MNHKIDKGGFHEIGENQNSSRSVLIFFALTFLFSWVVWITLIVFQVETNWSKIGAFGPTLAAVLLVGLQRGKDGIKTLLGRLLKWRVDWGWYAFVFLASPLIMIFAIQVFRWLGGRGLVFQDPARWYLTIPVFFYVLLTSVLGEEIGWRGYAFPGLLENNNALRASLIVGGVWALWHLPLFWLPGDFHQELPLLAFLVQVSVSSVIYGWMYVNTRGSLLLPHLFHAVTNTAVGLLPILPMSAGGDLRPFYITVVLLLLVAGLLPVFFGKDLKIRKIDR
jgi:membrane protease YdiL (CAAX protease family)